MNPYYIPGEISSGDGLKLKLGINGTIDLFSINNTYLPMLASQGGFSFREVLTNASHDLLKRYPHTKPGRHGDAESEGE
jgi:hypothetical protein